MEETRKMREAAEREAQALEMTAQRPTQELIDAAYAQAAADLQRLREPPLATMHAGLQALREAERALGVAEVRTYMCEALWPLHSREAGWLRALERAVPDAAMRAHLLEQEGLANLKPRAPGAAQH